MTSVLSRGCSTSVSTKNCAGALEQWIDLGEKCAVARVIPVVPQRAARARRRPSATCPRCAPSMGAAARHTSVLWCATQPRAPYMSLATLAPLTASPCGHAQQRLDALAQRRGTRGPVVHLRVDVDSPLAAPGRVGLLVPDALQVGGLRTLPRTRQQQVAAELKIQRHQRRILCHGETLHAFIGGPPFRFAAAQVELHAIEAGLKVRHVARLQRREVEFRRRGQPLNIYRRRIRRELIERAVVGRQRDQHQDIIRVLDVDASGGAADAPALRDHLRARLEFHRAADALVGGTRAVHHQGVAILDNDVRALRRGESHVHADALAGHAAAQVHHDHLVHGRRERPCGSCAWRQHRIACAPWPSAGAAREGSPRRSRYPGR